MNKENIQSETYLKINRPFFIGCILIYVAFIIDILIFQIEKWSIENLAPNETKIKRSIFVAQTFRFEESISSPIILFGPSEIGYLVLITIPLVSAFLIALSRRENSVELKNRNSQLLVSAVFFTIIDPIIILSLEVKLNYYDNNFEDFIWLGRGDILLFTFLLAIIVTIFGWIIVINEIQLSNKIISTFLRILLLIIILVLIAIFMYFLGGISNARIS